MAEKDDDRPRLQRIYELLGAPTDLYRNDQDVILMDSETTDLDPSQQATALRKERIAHLRSQSRWHYPVDYHLVQGSLPPLAASLCKNASTLKKVHDRVNYARASESNDNEAEASSSSSETEKEPSSKTTRKRKEPSETKKDGEYFEQQSLPLLQQSRAHVLLFPDGVPPRLDRYLMDDKAQRLFCDNAQRVISSYGAYDASYVPAKLRTTTDPNATPLYLDPRYLSRAQRYQRERMDKSEPEYLAPFASSSLREAMMAAEEAVSSQSVHDAEPSAPISRAKDRDVPKFLANDPNSPTTFGNCLLLTTCPCAFCEQQRRSATANGVNEITGSSLESSLLLLHPSGPLLDSVRLSIMDMPLSPIRRTKDGRPPTELDVGDSVRQIVKCGASNSTFVARTSSHITVFQIFFRTKEDFRSVLQREVFDDNDKICSCRSVAVQLRELHRIDLRSFSATVPSLFPVDACCHPHYGKPGWTDPKLAVLYYDDTQNRRNIIRHVMAGETLRSCEHTVTNLQQISQIDFSAHHPMVLWAVGKSYVRPVLTEDPVGQKHQKLRTGGVLGSDLYSVDLRCNEATFQWSPSTADWQMHGVHSLSGLLTDWTLENTVWVSSISAGKTWQIDSRMPCRAVNVWTLPGSCEDCETTLPSTRLHGAGTLLAQPISAYPVSDHVPSPILSINKCPETSFLHLLQRPDYAPLFQMPSIEFPSCPGALLENLSVATSSIFALPDVSSEMFTCGLAAFRVPDVSPFLSTGDGNAIGYSPTDITGTLCAVTMTNRGDVYAHSMLESRATHMRSKCYDGLPIGTRAIAVPTETSGDRSSSELRIKLQNKFPLPTKTSQLPTLRISSDAVQPPNGLENEEVTAPTKTIKPSLRTNASRSHPVDASGSVDTLRLPSDLLDKARKQGYDDSPDDNSRADSSGGLQLRSDVTADVVKESVTGWL